MVQNNEFDFIYFITLHKPSNVRCQTLKICNVEESTGKPQLLFPLLVFTYAAATLGAYRATVT